MAGFRIWARVERTGHRYAAFVCALPERPGSGPAVVDMRRHVYSSPHVAQLLAGFMAQSLRDTITARGDRVARIA